MNSDLLAKVALQITLDVRRDVPLHELRHLGDAARAATADPTVGRHVRTGRRAATLARTRLA
jgi:hypothetical protein